MDQHNLEIGGHEVLWAMHERTLLSDLKGRLEDIGYGNFAPEPRTDKEVLRTVLSGYYSSSRKNEKKTVRSQAKDDYGRDGFVVAMEKPGKDVKPGDEWSSAKVVVKLSENGVVTLDPEDWMALDDINSGVVDERKYVTKSAMGKMMVEILKTMDCVTLLESGGLYWIRDEHFDKLLRVAEAVEGATVRAPKNDDDHNKIHPLTLVANEHLVRACGDSLTREIETAMEAIQDELTNGELKEEACTNRIRAIGEMQQKISRYESSFGVAYEALREQTVVIAAAAANASLVGAAMRMGG